MQNIEVESRVRSAPVGFRRDYDAHVYFRPDRREAAARLRERVLAELRAYPILVSELGECPVGPHPLPMFEMNFSTDQLEAILIWLVRNRGTLSVMVHEVTGYDHRDHSQGAIWLGPPLALDESRLDPDPA